MLILQLKNACDWCFIRGFVVLIFFCILKFGLLPKTRMAIDNINRRCYVEKKLVIYSGLDLMFQWRNPCLNGNLPGQNLWLYF